MITMFVKLLITIMSAMSIQMRNPVKLMMMMLVISILNFLFMAMISGEVWFPILFTLLFMGGILMMFMILSAILPNEKSMKMKTFPMLILTITIISTSSNKFMEISASYKQMKGFMESSNNLTFMILILILYFFSMTTMLSKEELPMRSALCCEKKLIL